MRTIIDILKKGNNELFHSAMIAWLLDPEAEHSLGRDFIEHFSLFVENRGVKRLHEEINDTTPIIKTEIGGKGSRYDIVIEAKNYKAVIENKVKSLGNDVQLDKYKENDNDVIGLGLVDVTFNEDISNKTPILLYRDILSILDKFTLGRESPYEMLVDEYREYLRRELKVFDDINSIYFDSNSNNGANLAIEIEKMVKEGNYNDNDIRFFNYFYLEHLRRAFNNDDQLKMLEWVTNKNMISGPWLSSWRDTEKGFKIFKILADARDRIKVEKFWFHIQIIDGIAQSKDKLSGMLQIKTRTENDRPLWRDELTKRIELSPNQSWNKRVNKGPGEFYIVEEPFTREDMVVGKMVANVKKFMECFGNFI